MRANCATFTDTLVIRTSSPPLSKTNSAGYRTLAPAPDTKRFIPFHCRIGGAVPRRILKWRPGAAAMVRLFPFWAQGLLCILDRQHLQMLLLRPGPRASIASLVAKTLAISKDRIPAMRGEQRESFQPMTASLLVNLGGLRIYLAWNLQILSQPLRLETC